MLPPARLGIQGAETEMAVGLEGMHPELFSQREGLPVVHFGLSALWGIALSRDLAREPQGISLIAPLLVGTRELTRVQGELDGLVHAAGQEISFAQIGDSDSVADFSRRGRALYRLL